MHFHFKLSRLKFVAPILMLGMVICLSSVVVDKRAGAYQGPSTSKDGFESAEGDGEPIEDGKVFKNDTGNITSLTITVGKNGGGSPSKVAIINYSGENITDANLELLPPMDAVWDTSLTANGGGTLWTATFTNVGIQTDPEPAAINNTLAVWVIYEDGLEVCVLRQGVRYKAESEMMMPPPPPPPPPPPSPERAEEKTSQKVEKTSAPGTSQAVSGATQPEAIHKVRADCAPLTDEKLLVLDSTQGEATLELLSLETRKVNGLQANWVCVKAYSGYLTDLPPRCEGCCSFSNVAVPNGKKWILVDFPVNAAEGQVTKNTLVIWARYLVPVLGEVYTPKMIRFRTVLR